MEKLKCEIDSQTLPDHLIIDHILPRLPVKPLIRFKSVSKSWYSTISTPQFAISHLNYLSSHQFIFFNGVPSKLMLLPYDEESNTLKHPIEFDYNIHDFPTQPTLLIRFVGSCNGLICFECMRRRCESYFVICNPATHQYREITTIARKKSCYLGGWFGYVSSIDDYKIVSSTDSYVHVFSLKTGKCNTICDVDKLLFTHYSLRLSKMVVCDGFVYWNIQFRGQSVDYIVGLDVVNEQLKQFPVMNWLNQYNKGIEFFVMNGCLSLLCTSLQTPVFDVWTLKRSNDWVLGIWEKVFSFPLKEMFSLHVTTTGKILARDYCSSEKPVHEIKLIDPSQDTIEQCSLPISEWELFGVGGYVESLISPIGTFKSAMVEEDREA